jgi:hypothetical protein
MKIYNKNIIMYCTCAMKLISRWNWVINWSNDQLTHYRIKLSEIFPKKSDVIYTILFQIITQIKIKNFILEFIFIFLK